MGRNESGANGRDKPGLGSVRRPVIGLALGGGAARGFAHIGVLRTLLAHGIVPNVVVGTSIGAVVGGRLDDRLGAKPSRAEPHGHRARSSYTGLRMARRPWWWPAVP